MNVETEYRLSSTNQPVLNDLKDILPIIFSLLNAEDLQKTIQVCRRFRDVTEADFRYLSLYLQRRGTTRYHIERFQQLLQDYPKPNYRLMLKRIRQLNRLDLHLLSNVIRTRLDKMQFQTWQLAVITGNVNYILDPRHTELSSIIKAYHDENTASYYSRVACLLGMLNMEAEFRKLPIDIGTDPYVLESYYFGLGRKGHRSHVINLEEKSFRYLDVGGNQVMETDNVPLDNNLKRWLILGNLQCAKPLLIKDITYAEMMPLSFPASNIYAPALALACAFSSNLQIFQAFICHHTPRQNQTLKSANFVASVLLSDNLSLFDYLLRAELITINQTCFFGPHSGFTFHQHDRPPLFGSLNYAILDCEDSIRLMGSDFKAAKTQKERKEIKK